jgi:hypothetical protein
MEERFSSNRLSNGSQNRDLTAGGDRLAGMNGQIVTMPCLMAKWVSSVLLCSPSVSII